MVHWQTVEESDLFRWFGMHEIARTPMGGDVMIHLKPGGFAEYIDAEILIAASSLIRQATLTLDRAWMGAAQTPSPDACDLTKSFLHILAPEHPHACELANRIFDLLHANNRVIVRAGTFPLLPDPPSPPIEEALEVFLGVRDRAELTDRDPHVHLANIAPDGTHRFQITLTFAAADSRPVRGRVFGWLRTRSS